MHDTITITEDPTATAKVVPVGSETQGGEGTLAGEGVPGRRPPHFWAEYRARRGERIPRSELRFAMALVGESFCRLALASDVPFGRGCAEEARGTRGELREALVRLALAGGRAVARELARQRVAELGERADALTVDEARLEAALGVLGEGAVERVLGGRVGFRKAALFEAALRAEDPERCEAWVALAAAGVGRVRTELRKPGDGAGAPSAASTPSAEAPPRGTELPASAGEAHGMSPFGAELARALAEAG